MKIMTIGRDTDNDVIVSDSKVSRHHLQIISDGSKFRIVDLNSSNGTFVNGSKINREISLQKNDIVRIGSTILPWETYFKTKIPISLYAITGIFLAILIVGIFTFKYIGKTEKIHIKMIEKNGVYSVPMKINNQELDFVFDTGASSICISSLEASILVKNGTLNKSDIIGEEKYVDANGWISVGTKINLKTIELGGKKLRNVEATIIENPYAVCLLGQTVLSRFGKCTIDYKNKEIIFE